MLQRHERGVDEEATSGQAKQIFWGGLWSVMADEKLEHVARQKSATGSGSYMRPS